MKAIQILMDEHRVIERVLSSMTTAMEGIAAGSEIRPGFFLDAADFIQGFADAHHHQKEEDLLFVTMVAHGMPREEGPIGVMLSEHVQGRNYTRAMREAAQRWQDGDVATEAEVLRNGRGYVALLTQHIAKEDQVLYPMAESIIPAPELEQLGADFEKMENEESSQRVRDQYLRLAEALAVEIGA